MYKCTLIFPSWQSVQFYATSAQNTSQCHLQFTMLAKIMTTSCTGSLHSWGNQLIFLFYILPAIIYVLQGFQTGTHPNSKEEIQVLANNINYFAKCMNSLRFTHTSAFHFDLHPMPHFSVLYVVSIQKRVCCVHVGV